MKSDIAGQLAIRALMENWVLWRDAREWDRFRTLWHEDGRMMATWFQGGFEDFIKVSQQGFERGARILHMLGATTIDIKGKRAIAQAKTAISQRAEVEGVLCDVVCTGRFYVFAAKRKGRWGIVLMQPIYEKDRLDPVDPAATLKLDEKLLASFPEGYRHLAYLQVKNGYKVKGDLPGLDGPALDKVYAAGAAWLKGKPLGKNTGGPL
ncbi:MAG: nuclear transport factor 2 family protein [Hyphomicrobiales bacterium]